MRGLYILSAIYILFLHQTSAKTTYNESDMSALSIYYDPISRLPLRIASIEKGFNVVGTQSSSTKRLKTRRVGFRSNGCSCQESSCGCCTGINIQQFNFNNEGCMNFTYNPIQFSLTMDMFMNENRVFSNTISAKNPPPLCIPVPIPYLPSVDFCAKLFDIQAPAQNLHMCLDFETRIQREPILVLHFDCMRMGSAGFSVFKPGNSSVLPVVPASTELAVTDIDTYDEVTEIKYKHDLM